MEGVYAQVLYTEAHKDGADAKALVEKLVSHLKEHGREKLLPRILRELKRLEQRNTKLEAVVEVAHEKDRENALKEAAELGITAHHTHVNHNLISGWRASVNGKLIDKSGKAALIDLYQKIVTP